MVAPQAVVVYLALSERGTAGDEHGVGIGGAPCDTDVVFHFALEVAGNVDASVGPAAIAADQDAVVDDFRTGGVFDAKAVYRAAADHDDFVVGDDGMGVQVIAVDAVLVVIGISACMDAVAIDEAAV